MKCATVRILTAVPKLGWGWGVLGLGFGLLLVFLVGSTALASDSVADPASKSAPGSDSGSESGSDSPDSPGVTLGSALSSVSAAEEAFAEANRQYEAGNYRAATAAYAQVVSSGYQSPEVWLNLGNAFFRSGEKGRAIHAFESGLRLAPSDPDLRSNLELAREDITTESPAAGNTFLEWLSRTREWFPLDRSLVAVSVLWWISLFWVAGALLRRRLGLGYGWAGGILAALWGVAIIWIGVLIVSERSRPDTVVVVEAVAVRSNPDASSTVEFRLPMGTAFRAGRENPEFVEVLYSEDLQGWTERNGVASIGAWVPLPESKD